MLQLDEIKKQCEKTVKDLRELLPEKVDYAELVCAEGFARGMHYVWTDPEPYAMDAAATLIEDMMSEIERLQAELERTTRERDAAVVCINAIEEAKSDTNINGTASDLRQFVYSSARAILEWCRAQEDQ